MSFDQPDCHTSESCYHKTHADTAWASQDTRRHRLGVRGQRKRRFASAARQRQDLRQKPERRFASEARDICVRGQRGLRQITERGFASKARERDDFYMIKLIKLPSGCEREKHLNLLFSPGAFISRQMLAFDIELVIRGSHAPNHPDARREFRL